MRLFVTRDTLIKQVFGLLLFLVAGAPSLSHGYYSTLDTAELLKPGEYQAGLEPQYIFDNYPGGNIIGRFDMAANENGNYRFLLGTGRTQFQAGAFYKIVPIPDFDNQPGIGVFGGVLYAYQGGNSALNFRIHPEISKRFKSVDAGEITPYGAIPFGVAFTGGNTYFPLQIAIGARWLPSGMKHVHFWSEFGFELDKDGFSYISLGLTVPFSDNDPFKFD